MPTDKPSGTLGSGISVTGSLVTIVLVLAVFALLRINLAI